MCVGAFHSREFAAVLECSAGNAAHGLRKYLIIQTGSLEYAGFHFDYGIGNDYILQHVTTEEARIGKRSDAGSDFDGVQIVTILECAFFDYLYTVGNDDGFKVGACKAI